jgi:hypothetical protein
MSENQVIIFKSKDYTYPTLAERNTASEFIPFIKSFEFNEIHSFISVLSNELSIDEATKIDSLCNWNLCLKNRLGKLKETFANSYTHYLRYRNMNDNESLYHLNVYLYEYYCEIFYYYFFSTRDVICHVINIYFDLKIPEYTISLNEKFIQKITNDGISIALAYFDSETLESKKIRNQFVHRLTPTQEIYGVSEFIEGGVKKWGWDAGAYISNDSLKDNMIKSLNDLSILMNKLSTIIYSK